jgi:hypothetical protein
MKGQKQAVVEYVKQELPSFVPYKDIAIVMLTNQQLELIKRNIACDIINGNVEYSKEKTNSAEVHAYARSMVMNHMKKAKELNGNQIYGVGSAAAQLKQSKASTEINTDILSDDLKTFVKTLV